MIIKFDAFNRFEVPKILLCNPGSKLDANGRPTKQVGYIELTSDEELVANFNEASEFNLRAYKPEVEGDTLNRTAAQKSLDIYQKIQNRRLLYLDGIGYFVITECTTEYDGTHYKDIAAKSIEEEFAQRNIPSFEDLYREENPDADPDTIFYTFQFGTLLEKLISSMPLWKIATNGIDPSLENLARTFEDISEDTNILAFMMENMQDAYECIIEFDIQNRLVYAYAQDNYVYKTSIHLTRDDFVKELSIKENADDIYTAIQVFGSEDVTINAVNPLATNTIYDFSYYYDWMSDDLKDKMMDWENAVLVAEASFQGEDGYGRVYQNAVDSVSNLKAELDRLENLKRLYTQMYNNVSYAYNQYNHDDAKSAVGLLKYYYEQIGLNGGELDDIDFSILDGEKTAETEADIENEKAALIQAINDYLDEVNGSIASTEAAISSAESAAETAKSQIEAISSDLQLENYLTEEQFEELFPYISEGKYTDEYITVTKDMSVGERYEQMIELYRRAKDQIKKISHPTLEFDVDVENFIFEKRFQAWSEQLETGRIINVEIDTDNIAELFLLTFTVNYDDKSLSMTFGNRFNKYDVKSLFKDALGNISRTANTVSYIKDAVYPIRTGTIDRIQQEIQNSRNLSMDAALATSDQDIIIDESGYTGRTVLDDGSVLDAQIKIVNDQIIFTTDGWKTAALAIGRIIYLDEKGESHTFYGVNAGALISDIILTQQLKVRNEESSITLDKDGITFDGLKEYYEDGNPIPQKYGNVTTMIDVNGIDVAQGVLETTDTQLLYDGTIASFSRSGDYDEVVPTMRFDDKAGYSKIKISHNDLPVSDRNIYTFNMDGTEIMPSDVIDDVDIICPDIMHNPFRNPIYITKDLLLLTSSYYDYGVSEVGSPSFHFSVASYTNNANVNISRISTEYDDRVEDEYRINVETNGEDSYVILLCYSVGPNGGHGKVYLITGRQYQDGEKIFIYTDRDQDNRWIPNKGGSAIHNTSSIIARIINLIMGSFLSILSKATKSGRDLIDQKFNEIAIRIRKTLSPGVEERAALCPDALVFSDDSDGAYAYYGSHSAYSTALSSDNLFSEQAVFNNCSILGGYLINATQLQSNGFNVLPLGGCHEEIPSNADLNTYITPGVYGIVGNNIAQTLQHRPSSLAGILRVFDSAGSWQHSNWNSKYGIQEYIVYDNSVRFLRSFSTSDSGNTWTFQPWKIDDTSASGSISISGNAYSGNMSWKKSATKTEIWVRGTQNVWSAQAWVGSGGLARTSLYTVNLPNDVSVPSGAFIIGTSNDQNMFLLQARLNGVNTIEFRFGWPEPFNLTDNPYHINFSFYIVY